MTPGVEAKQGSWRARLGLLADRAVVLFMGVGVGLAIGLAFAGGGSITPGRRPPPAAALRATASPPARMVPAPPAECAAPFPPRLTARIAAGQPVTIGVFGDSFADGVWAALYRRMGKDNVKVLKLGQEGTGFTRYQTLNLERKAADNLKAEPVDIAVVIIGANDTQGLFDDDHLHAYALMSPGWKTVYGARIDRFVSLIRDQGAMVYWVGLPKMRQPGYDQDIAAVGDFQASRMAALNVPFLTTRELSVDPRGEFNLYLDDPDTHAPRLMRANDGVHMTMAGYERLAGPLIDRIHGYLAHAAASPEAVAAAARVHPAGRS